LSRSQNLSRKAANKDAGSSFRGPWREFGDGDTAVTVWLCNWQFSSDVLRRPARAWRSLRAQLRALNCSLATWLAKMTTGAPRRLRLRLVSKEGETGCVVCAKYKLARKEIVTAGTLHAPLVATPCGRFRRQEYIVQPAASAQLPSSRRSTRCGC